MKLSKLSTVFYIFQCSLLIWNLHVDVWTKYYYNQHEAIHTKWITSISSKVDTKPVKKEKSWKILNNACGITTEMSDGSKRAHGSHLRQAENT